MERDPWMEDATAALEILRDCPRLKRPWLAAELGDLLIDTEGQRERKRVQPARGRGASRGMRSGTPVSPFAGRRVFAPGLGVYLQCGESAITAKQEGSCFLFRILGVACRDELGEDHSSCIDYEDEEFFVRAQWYAVVNDIDTLKDNNEPGSLYVDSNVPESYQFRDGACEVILRRFTSWYPASCIMGVAFVFPAEVIEQREEYIDGMADAFIIVKKEGPRGL